MDSRCALYADQACSQPVVPSGTNSSSKGIETLVTQGTVCKVAQSGSRENKRQRCPLTYASRHKVLSENEGARLGKFCSNGSADL
jgi:hypothetical protein